MLSTQKIVICNGHSYSPLHFTQNADVHCNYVSNGETDRRQVSASESERYLTLRYWRY